LLVGRPEERDRDEQAQKRDHAAHLLTRERLDRAGWRFPELILWQERRSAKVDTKADQHADASGGKAKVPAGLLTERTADQRREERSKIDANVENRIGAVAARITGDVQSADLRRNVRLEAAIAENERQQRK